MDALEDDLNEKLTIEENLSKSIVLEWDEDFIRFFLYTYVHVENYLLLFLFFFIFLILMIIWTSILITDFEYFIIDREEKKLVNFFDVWASPHKLGQKLFNRGRQILIILIYVVEARVWWILAQEFFKNLEPFGF